mgnify:CR=1 FL=1
MSMKNDMAFLLAGALNLYEHQSTFCPNLPLRFLLYIAAEYESLAAIDIQHTDCQFQAGRGSGSRRIRKGICQPQVLFIRNAAD